ncbi:uba ts-n domain protein [Lentinula edodes]|uniref:Uba ts-n domain protein n=1 Tax=Lentinula edodes TaxID=5353 RepID=A0A1Q3E1B8_LENED|nr:uba ts-n domain protein [Lentinula edodes]
MSDSFADLWNSAVPSKPTPQPQKLGSLSSQSNPPYPRQTQNDLFAQLASRGSSVSNSRSATPPSAIPASSHKGFAKPSSQNSNGDAFSGLFGAGSSLASNRSTANMTIAERAALVEKERLERSIQQRQAPSPTHSTAWDGLDSLGSKTFATSPTNSHLPLDHDWTLTAPSVLKSVVLPPVLKPEDEWGLANFANTSAPATTSKPSHSGAVWDLDEFSTLDSTSRGLGPGKWDEVTANDGPDDILGDLSRPIEAIQREKHENSRRNVVVSPPKSPSLREPSPNRSNSPPPHILGQLIEMGFSITQARTALASTDSGQNVQAALDILISNGAIGPGEDYGDEAGSFSGRNNSQNQRTPSPQEEPKPRLRRDRQIIQERQRERNTSSPSELGGLQADKILAQASEIGFSLFNRANAAWKEGKERVQKVYEEKVAATAEGSTSRRGSGRSTPLAMATKPKWMQDNEGLPDTMIDHTKKEARPVEKPSFSTHTEVVDLFSDTSSPESSTSQLTSQPSTLSVGSSNGVYVSKFRHAKPKVSDTTSGSASLSPHPITLVSAPESTIALSQESKASGAHFYKLGDFPAADTAYTRAIEALPAGHALLIPLYNNRALVRLKVGDVQGVIADTKKVEELIGGVGTVREELRKGDLGKIPVKGSKQGSGDDVVINMPDALIKAWKRRAEAMEGREKWEDAGKDWEKVASAEWAGKAVRAEGASGAGRCRKMQQGGSSHHTPKFKPSPPIRPPSHQVPSIPSQALNALRAANEAAEVEDSHRYRLKDGVDARLQSWKGGKENNIRALLASLDTVLWPELGVQKLSMAELLNKGQVKVKYMKCIAKVHPDKLNEGNSTLEQRMIAAGVFGALNEAWNAFKP